MKVNNINEFVTYLCDKKSSSFVVTSSANKSVMLKLIDQVNGIVPVKVITVQEFYQLVVEIGDENKFYHHDLISDLSVGNQKLFLKHAMYVDSSTKYISNKLIVLQGLKNDLKISVQDILKDKAVYLYDIEDQFLIDYFNDYTLVSNVIDREVSGVFYKFDDVYKEVFYQVDQVVKLIESGVDINEIAVVCPTNEYIKYARILFELHNIDVNYQSDGRSLFATKVGSDCLELIKDYCFEDVIQLLVDKYPTELDVIKKVIKVINKYHHYHQDLTYVMSYIIDDFKNTKLDQVIYQDCVNLISIDEVDKYQHVYVLGFNNKVLFKMSFNDDFLTDEDRVILNMSTSTMLNEYDKNRIYSLLCNDNIKSISYAKVSSEGELSISNLSMMFKDYQVVKINDVITDKSFSLSAHKLLFNELHDGYVKFNTKSDDLSILNNSVELTPKVAVGTKNIDKINDLDHIRLSASSLESYYSCEYRFYLERILKLGVANSYDWHLVIGNYIHYILEHIIDQDSIDVTLVKQYASEYITTSEREYSVEELFYLTKIIDEIVLIANVIDNQFNDCTVLGLEKAIDFKINEQFSFSGKIDKVLADGDNHLVIIDYKTGDSTLKFDHINHGLGMQNMIYLYLMHQVDEDYQLAGTFRQNIKPKLIKASDFQSYAKFYQVSGLIDKNQELFVNENLSTLKCTLKKDGEFSSRSNLLVDQTSIRELESIVVDKINDAMTNISNHSFRINPKKNKNIDSCKYCKYQEICLKKESTYEQI